MAPDNLFRARLDAMIDLKHPLAVLSTQLAGHDPILTPRGCGEKIGMVEQRSPGFCEAQRSCEIRVRS